MGDPHVDLLDGTTLLRWRTRAGMSVELLAEAAEVDRQTIYRWQAKKNVKGHPAKVRRVVDALTKACPEFLEEVTSRVAHEENRRTGRGARLLEEYQALVRSGLDSVDLLGCGFRQVLQDFAPTIVELSTTVAIRVLLLDPDSAFAEQREREEGEPLGGIRADVGRWTEFVATLPEDHLVEVKKYRAMPTVSITRLGTTIFWGPYLLDVVSRNMITFRCEKGSDEFTTMQAQFDRLWLRPVRI